MARSAKWWITLTVFILPFIPPIKSSNTTQRKFQCPKDYMASGKVCGSDDVTYANRCELELARTEDNPLGVQYLGKCVVKKDTKCDVWEPVCGNDYLTYWNDCEFQLARANRSLLKMVHTGPCLGLWGWWQYYKNSPAYALAPPVLVNVPKDTIIPILPAYN
ncbi:kazal-type serine protease inhibitor domain-containing protein [Phthorimaea operculella]|nr:kazal-type serine protease inhibitor domain-containing protein [Phthorimaea operculella]